MTGDESVELEGRFVVLTKALWRVLEETSEAQVCHPSALMEILLWRGIRRMQKEGHDGSIEE